MTQTALLLLLLLTLQVSSEKHYSNHSRSRPGENLVPYWQFDGKPSTWEYRGNDMKFELQTEIVEWTDGRLVRALKCVEGHNPNKCYPCWALSDFIPIDRRIAYEFSIYIKSTNQDVQNFWGFFAYDQNHTRISDKWDNPYFKTFGKDQFYWRRWNAYILPSYTDNNGIADKQSNGSNGIDWIWPPKARYVRVRFGSCYGNGVGQDRTWFVFPSVTEVTPQMNMIEEQWNHLSSAITTFDISNPEDWNEEPVVGGMAFVNGQYTPIHRSVESGKGCYNEAVSRNFRIDNTKQYEFSAWILSKGRDIDNYLGFYVYNRYERQIITGSIANPRFKSRKDDTAEWVRWNGFILPSNVPSSTLDYNKPRGIPSHFSTGVDWKWPSNALYAAIRFGCNGTYGDGNNQGVSYFALPQVLQSDLQL